MKSILLPLLLPLFLVTSCSSDDGHGTDDNLPSCDEDTRDEAYVAGINKTGEGGYTIAIMEATPAPPAKGDNAWTVEIRDSAGAPVTGLTMDCDSFMPDHGHGTPIIPAVIEVGDGVYTLDPVNLFMPGYWETTMTAVDKGATDSPDDDVDLDSVTFKFCVEG
jgi:hypothetical protein